MMTMMNNIQPMISGIMEITDESFLETLKLQLQNTPSIVKYGIVPGNTVIVLDMDDESDNLLESWSENVERASILMPPPSVVEKLVDGKIDESCVMYQSYLRGDPGVQEFISNILYCLFKGANVILYSPQGIYEDSFINNMIKVAFQDMYGIIIGTPNNPCSYDINYDLIIADLLYYYNHINAYAYAYYTRFMQINRLADSIYPKLVADLTPLYPQGTDILKVFEDLRDRARKGLLLPNSKPAIFFDV